MNLNYFKTLKNREFLLTTFFFIIHVIFYKSFPLNFSGAFGLAVDNFSKFNILDTMKIFYAAQSNSIFFSYVAFIFKLFLPLNGHEIIKILSASSYFFLYIFYYNLKNKIKFPEREYFLLLLFLNPLIFIFAFKGLNDLFSYSIGLAGISILIKNSNFNEINFKIFLGCLLLSLGICLKVFNLILILILFQSLDYNLKRILKLGTLILILPILFNFYIYYQLDFFLIKSSHDIDTDVLKNLFSNLHISNIINYIGFFCLISLPISLCFFINLLENKKYLFFLIISFPISFFLMKINTYHILSDEIGFGISNKFFNNSRINFFQFFCYMFVLNYLAIVFFFKKKSWVKDFKNFFSIFLIYIILISLFKGSQRYLILMLPLFYLIIFSHININKKYIRKYLIFIVCFLFSINFAHFSHNYLNSTSMHQITNYISKNKLNLSHIHPGLTSPHLYFMYVEPSTFHNAKMTILTEESKIKFQIEKFDVKNINKYIFYTNTKFFNKNVRLYGIRKYY